MTSLTTERPVPRISAVRQIWNFGRHYVEMCVAMCIGVGLTGLLLRGAAQAGQPDLRQQFPGLTLLGIAVVITLPMIAWMRFRRMEWRPILEMSVAGLVVVFVAASLGLVSASTVAVGSVCGLACLGMLVAMLFRLDLYTGRTGHHAGHAAHRA